GRNLGTYALPGNTDNEDIGIGPGPVTNVSYLYVTDIGDNNAVRTSIAIYQTPEPAVYFWQTNAPVSNRAMNGTRTITLTYPDGAHDAEAEFVDSATGDWFVLTKSNTSSIFSEASNGIPVVGTAAGEPNGEAIGFDYYGGGYFTLSDSEPTGAQPLHYFARTSFDGPTPPRVLAPPAASWKYLASGSDQGTAWRNSDFDDSSWSSGAAQLGYGDGDEQTVVSYGADAGSKYI